MSVSLLGVQGSDIASQISDHQDMVAGLHLRLLECDDVDQRKRLVALIETHQLIVRSLDILLLAGNRTTPQQPKGVPTKATSRATAKRHIARPTCGVHVGKWFCRNRAESDSSFCHVHASEESRRVARITHAGSSIDSRDEQSFLRTLTERDAKMRLKAARLAVREREVVNDIPPEYPVIVVESIPEDCKTHVFHHQAQRQGDAMIAWNYACLPVYRRIPGRRYEGFHR